VRILLILGFALTAAAGDPATIERGRYMFNLADCAGCHSERDYTRFAGPVVPGGLGRGFVFPPELGLPGKVVAPNITPDRETGIGAWTDTEKIRAIRDGIGRDGKPLFPMMPYEAYRHMSDRDVKALVAYMNTLAPVKNPLPRTQLPPGMKLPPLQPAGTVPDPDASDRVKYGEYLVTLGTCAHCHTPLAEGHPDTSKLFAGGQDFKFPGGASVVSSNITPDPETGIGKWTQDQFVKRFHMYRPYLKTGAPKAPFTLMPWLALAGTTGEDLQAMYAYLKTVKPVKNNVRAEPVQ
jgi:mono/diheme cytochrome c family protein